jgi:acyl-CoA synthetase (NDP forming)
LPLILADHFFGSLVLGIILTDEPTSGLKFPPIIDAISELKASKPVIFAGLDEGAQVLPAYIKQLRALGVPFFPTPERAYRALALITSFASGTQRESPSPPRSQPYPMPVLATGVIPEYKSKQILRALGIKTPESLFARTFEEGKAAASSMGFPVALKAQSAKLSHKSEAGGVALNVRDEEALAAAWTNMYEAVARACPGLVLDGVLVEKMGARGTELIVGVRNDPDWGPVLLIGAGGVLAESLHDVRLIPPDLPVEAIEDEILKLKSAALLRGFRGSPALDIRAVAEVIHRIGGFVLANPKIKEMDINPVVVYERGLGAVALDALIVTE